MQNQRTALRLDLSNVQLLEDYTLEYDHFTHKAWVDMEKNDQFVLHVVDKQNGHQKSVPINWEQVDVELLLTAESSADVMRTLDDAPQLLRLLQWLESLRDDTVRYIAHNVALANDAHDLGDPALLIEDADESKDIPILPALVRA
mgnify:CR=1 FL=1